MISEFQDLSDKIDRLAAMTLSLRNDNGQLRQANKQLNDENAELLQRLGEAQRRVEALLELLPGPGDEPANEAMEASE